MSGRRKFPDVTVILSTTFKCGQRYGLKTVFIIPRITFSQLKQSMPFPPPEAWTSGRCDVVLINTNNNNVWPHSGLEGVSSSYMTVSS